MENTNWKCKECGNVCGKKESAIKHWRKHHKGSWHGMIEPTSENPTYTKVWEKRLRSTVNQLGKVKNINYKCKKCGHVCKTESGIRSHLDKNHQSSVDAWMFFENTSDKITNTFYKRRKQKKRKSSLRYKSIMGARDIFDKVSNGLVDNQNNGKDDVVGKEFSIEIKISSAGMLVITPMPIKISQIVYPEKE